MSPPNNDLFPGTCWLCGKVLMPHGYGDHNTIQHGPPRRFELHRCRSRPRRISWPTSSENPNRPRSPPPISASRSAFAGPCFDCGRGLKPHGPFTGRHCKCEHQGGAPPSAPSPTPSTCPSPSPSPTSDANSRTRGPVHDKFEEAIRRLHEREVFDADGRPYSDFRVRATTEYHPRTRYTHVSPPVWTSVSTYGTTTRQQSIPAFPRSSRFFSPTNTQQNATHDSPPVWTSATTSGTTDGRQPLSPAFPRSSKFFTSTDTQQNTDDRLEQLLATDNLKELESYIGELKAMIVYLSRALLRERRFV